MRHALLIAVALAACTPSSPSTNSVEERIEYWSSYLVENPLAGVMLRDAIEKLSHAGAACSESHKFLTVRCLDSWGVTTRSGLTFRLAIEMQIGPDGAQESLYQENIREKIEQVLFTDPGERVFRPEFGAGVRQLVFEPNSISIVAIAQKRLQKSLEEALRGDVDPKDLEIKVAPDPSSAERLVIEVRYALPAVNLRERLRFEGS